MADDRLKFLVQNFGGQYGGYGISETIDRRVLPKTSSQPRQAPQNIFQKIGSIASSTARIGAQVLGRGAGYVANTAIDIGRDALGVVRTFNDTLTQPFQHGTAVRMNDELDRIEGEIIKQKKSGQITEDDYTEKLKHLTEARQEVTQKLIKPITQGPTPVQRAEELVDTAINVLTLGRWTPLKQVGATAAKQTVLSKSLGTAVKTLESTVMRIPAAKELIARNVAAVAKREAQRMAGETLEQYVAREGRRVAVGLLIKRPLFYQQNIQDATNVYQGMMNGEYGEAAKSSGWLALQMLGGGPIGWFMRQGKKAGVKLRELSFGRGSLIDRLSAEIGNKNPAQIGRYITKLKDKAPQEYERAVRVFRIMQETNLRVAGERVDEAVENILRNYDLAGVARENINPGMFVRDYERWYEAAQITDALKGSVIKGLDTHQVNNLVVVRWDSVMKRGLAETIEAAGDSRQAMLEALDDMANRSMNGWGNNPLLMKQLHRIVYEAPDAATAAKRIKAIPTAAAIPSNLPKSVRTKLEKLGYGVAVPLRGVRKTPMVKLEETRNLVSGAIRGDSEVFDIATEPKPVLSAIAGALSKAGLSPQGINEQANRALRQSLAASMSELDISRTFRLAGEDTSTGGAAILSQLQRYVETKKPAWGFGKISSGRSAVTDVRMLTTKEIKEALGDISTEDAKLVKRAIIDAYTKVPLELRGLGDRVVDYAFKYNPAQKYYARIQSALRYTYNPFFRVQEQVETAALARMNADKFLWLKSRDELNSGVEQLTRAGFFDGNLMSAAADDQVLGRISANMTKAQKRNLSGLALTMAERKGITLEQMISQYPDELEDAMRVIVQYPRKGSISSPLARTINIAFFPMRYNAKVSMMAAKKIGELPPSVQLGVVQGFLKMKDWMQSDEGIRWQSEHADAIQVFKWVTPYGSIEQFYKVATGNVEAAGDLGLLGGLPFGIISQVLDSMGIINLNTPYIDPKTGSQFPDYIPKTTQAQAAVALTDLLGSMFSFPGRTLGLPGKEATLRSLVRNFLETNGEDFEKRYDTESLTPLQQRMIRVLKGDTSDEAIDDLFAAPAEGQFNYYTIPTFDLPVARVPEAVEVISRGEVRRKREGSQRAERVARPITRPE